MKIVEEPCYVLSLRTEASPRIRHDRRVQPDMLRHVNSRRCTRYTDSQFISWSQRPLVESDGSIQYTRRVRCVYLQGRMVGGNDRDALHPPEKIRDSNRQGGAFFGVCRRTEFIEHDQRAIGRSMRDEVDVGYVRGKCREVLLNRLVVANIGENIVENRELCSVCGNWHSRLAHQDQKAHGLQRHGLAAGVRTTDDELAMLTIHLEGHRHNPTTLRTQVPLQQRMPRIADNDYV